MIILIKRDIYDIDKNLWGTKCSCGNIVYGFFEESLFLEENISKEIICSNCNKISKVKIETARRFYNELIYDCFKDVKGKVLELGCGGGLLTKYLASKKDVESVVAVDNEMEGKEINFINSLDKCLFVEMDLNDFDETLFSNKFDYIVCKDVLMYLDNIECTFSKLSKISHNIILLNWFNTRHKNCLNKMAPIDAFEVIKRYYKDIEIIYPSFYKWGYIIKTYENQKGER